MLTRFFDGFLITPVGNIIGLEDDRHETSNSRGLECALNAQRNSLPPLEA